MALIKKTKKEKTLDSDKIAQVISSLKGDAGYTPIKGKDYNDGYTPVKGKDYFDGKTPTDDELLNLIIPLMPEVKDGHTPTVEELVAIIKPLMPKVKDGETPTDERLIKLITPLIPEPKSISCDEVINEINSKEEVLNFKTIKGLSSEIDSRIPKQMVGSPRIKVFNNGQEMSAPLGSINFLNGTITNHGQDYSYTGSGGGGGSQNLQQVTDIGAITTNIITVGGINDAGSVLSINPNTRKMYEPDGITEAIDFSKTTYPLGTYLNTLVTDSIFSAIGNLVSFGSNGDHSIVTNSIKDASGNTSVDAFNRMLKDSSGNEKLNWGNSELLDTGLTRLNWQGMTLARGSNVTVYNWDLGLLYWNNGTQHVVADLSVQKLFDMTDQTSIDWGARLAYANNGSTVIMNYNNSTGARFGASIQVGRTDTAPVSAIHVDKGNATESQLKFTAGTTTGLTATDGFDIGITTTGVAEIRQYESQPIRFYTANVNYISFLSNEPTILLDSQASNSVNAGKVVYRTASGAESFTTTFNASDNRFYFLYGATTVGSVTSTGWGFGITAFAPSATIHAISIGEQLRLGFDATNRTRFEVQSDGVLRLFNNASTTYGVQFGGGNNEIRLRGGQGALTHSGAELTLASDTRLRFQGSVVYAEANFGAGTGSTVSARIHAISTTEQFRSGYDASNYNNAITNATGRTTFNAISATNVGEFVFSKGIALPYVAKTATYTTTVQDYTVDCTTGTYTINLVTAVGNAGKIFVIKNTGAGTITVDANGTETIDGALTVTLATNQSVTVQSTGANYIII